MTHIITTPYRYKRPPRKKPKAAALEMPAVATIAGRKREKVSANMAETPKTEQAKKVRQVDAPSYIATTRKPGAPIVADTSPEEHTRRGDAPEAMFREMVRKVGGK